MNKEYVLEKLAQTSTSLTVRGMTGREKFNEFFRNGWSKFKNAKTPSKFALIGAAGGLAGLGLSKLFGGSKKNDMSKEGQWQHWDKTLTPDFDTSKINNNGPSSSVLKGLGVKDKSSLKSAPAINKGLFSATVPDTTKPAVPDTNKAVHPGTWGTYNMSPNAPATTEQYQQQDIIDTSKSKPKAPVVAPDTTKSNNSKPPVVAPKSSGKATGASGTTFAEGLKTLKSGATTADSVKTLGNLPFTVDDSMDHYQNAGPSQTYSLRQNQHTKNVYSDIAGVNMEAINMNLRHPIAADKMKEGYEGLQGYYDKLKANPKDRNNYQNFIFAKAKMDWAANKDKNVTFDKIMQDNHKLYSSNTDNLGAMSADDVIAFDKPAAPTGLKKKTSVAPVTAAGAAVNPVPGQFNPSYPFSSPKPVDFGTPNNKLAKPPLQMPKSFKRPINTAETNPMFGADPNAPSSLPSAPKPNLYGPWKK